MNPAIAQSIQPILYFVTLFKNLQLTGNDRIQINGLYQELVCLFVLETLSLF